MKKSELKQIIREELSNMDEGRFSSESNAGFDEQRKHIQDTFTQIYELEDELLGVLDSLNNNSPFSNTQIYTLRAAIIDGFKERN